MAPLKRASGWVLIAALAVLLLLALGATAPASSLAAPIRADSSGSVSSTVFFNGVNVSSHTTSGAAIVTNFSGVFSTVFTWTSGIGAAPATVTEGVVSLLFLGIAIGTSTQQQTEAGHGVITLKSDFSQNQYLFEGNYEIQATLQNNGTTVFTQDFYIWVQATDHLTLVNVALVLIALLEIWQVAALGSVKKARQQLGLGQNPPPTTPSPAAPSAATPGPATPPSTSAPPTSPPPANPPSDTPPPSGGT
ncbi:MAG: hypothetical protein ACLPZM_01015 [Thermoplasmata archaeon]